MGKKSELEPLAPDHPYLAHSIEMHERLRGYVQAGFRRSEALQFVEGMIRDQAQDERGEVEP